MLAASKEPSKTAVAGCFHLTVSEGSEPSLSKLPNAFQYKALCQFFMPLPCFRLKVYMLGIGLKQFLLSFFKFQLKQYSCFWITMNKRHAVLPTIKSFQPSPHLALPTLQLRAQPKALATSRSRARTFSAISGKTHPNLAILPALENKTSTAMCLQIQVFEILFLKCTTPHFGLRTQCFVDYCLLHCPKSHATCNQAGRNLTLNKTYLFQIPWLWLLFQQHVVPSIILTRLTAEENKKAQKQPSLINLEI